MQKYWISVVIMTVVGIIINYIISGILLASAYAETANLWRPAEEMNFWLLNIPIFIAILCMVWVFERLFKVTNMVNAIYYSIAWGLATGVGMGLGMYSVLPVSGSLGFYWFITTLIQWIILGFILGWVYSSGKPRNRS